LIAAISFSMYFGGSNGSMDDPARVDERLYR
jgi:hypothetical protein